MLSLAAVTLTAGAREAQQAVGRRSARHVLQVSGPTLGGPQERGQKRPHFEGVGCRNHAEVSKTHRYYFYFSFHSIHEIVINFLNILKY